MKYNFKIYSIKKITSLIIFVFSIACLLILSSTNFSTTSTSISLFLSSVAPSLFPFIFFTEFILKTDIINILSDFIGQLFSRIFRINKKSVSCVIIGFLCGFPMGAKTVAKLYEYGIITHNEAKKLLAFTNNCNPAFIISTIGIGIFSNISIGILLLISHYISAIIIGIIFPLNTHVDIIHNQSKNLNIFYEKKKNKDKNYSFFDAIKISILNSFVTLGLILGFIILFNILFNIIATFLQNINIDNYYINILSGIFEVTKGTFNIYNLDMEINLKLCITSFCLGFSGLCILSQIYSCIYMHNFSFKNIIIPKIFQGILSFVITFIILNFTNIFCIDSTAVFSNLNTSYNEIKYVSSIKISYIILGIEIAILMLFALFRHKKSSLNGK